MIVYYVAESERPSSLSSIRFYLDVYQAREAASESRGCSVYQFEVNDKLDAQNFGMETILVFRKDFQTGELKFMASGLWLEVHSILNVPFNVDFETNSKTFVSMSLSYFNSHYSIVKKEGVVEQEEFEPVEVVEEEVISVQAQPIEEEIDEEILDELFGGAEQRQPVNSDLAEILL